jgi:multicomponent Na+:H+ antiporter subunit G
MKEWVTAVLLLTGGAFMLLASVGITRMPDLFTRMQAATKASTLGASFMLMGVAAYFAELGVTSRALAVVVFIILTAPVAAHMIARAAYFVRVPLWEETIADELRDRYDPRTHELASGSPNHAAEQTNQRGHRGPVSGGPSEQAGEP